MTTTECPRCHDDVDPLGIFPGGYDLKCWAALHENDPMPTADEIVRMWSR